MRHADLISSIVQEITEQLGKQDVSFGQQGREVQLQQLRLFSWGNGSSHHTTNDGLHNGRSPSQQAEYFTFQLGFSAGGMEMQGKGLDRCFMLLLSL